MATAFSEMKPRQPQITRIRKEEEEENWISGEELNTDGSSDEEACGGRGSQSSFSCQLPRLNPTLKGSSHVDRELVHRTISAPAHLQQIPPLLPGTYDCGIQLEEQEEVMLWRPKRGSIKLPHHIEHDKKKLSSSSGRQPQQQKVSG